MNNKITLFKNEFEVIAIDRDELSRLSLLDFEYYWDYLKDRCETVEELETELYEVAHEVADNAVPIYNNQVNDEFNSLSIYEVDSLIEEAKWTYGADALLSDGYTRFQQQVLYSKYYQEVCEDIRIIIDNIEIEDIEEIEE